MKTVIGTISGISFLLMIGFVGGVECDNIGMLPGFAGAFASLLVFGVSLLVLDYLAWRDNYR